MLRFVLSNWALAVALPLALATGMTAGVLSAEGLSNSLRALFVAYRCEVVGRLERIHEHGNPSAHRNRFLAITLDGHPHSYVQCIFFDHRSKILCEASSGFYFSKPRAKRGFRLFPAEVDALARLGFSTGKSRGNFDIEFDVGMPPDFNAIADFMLTALHDGYGARADSVLRFNAPFAPRPETNCIPVS